MKKNFYLIALFAVVLLGACSGGEKESEGIEKKEEKPVVKLANVFARPVDQIIEYTATVEAEAKNNIAPSSAVRIDKILVEVGDRVVKGQRLVEMSDNSLKQLKLRIENQKIEFNRIDELYKVGGVSKSEWDAAKMAVDVNEEAYQNLLENTSLISPLNGIVTARNYDNGDMYNNGAPVLTVEQVAPVKLIINVSESYFTKVTKGADASIKLDVYGDEEFTGKIALVHPTINPDTRTFQVEVKVENKNLKVRPGMFARVILNFGTLNHVVVPDMAIVKQAGSGDRYVWVYKNGKVSYDKVELGRRMNTEYELISGVDDNAQIVIAGQARLQTGVEVEVAKD
ncbi:efflux RND transporter periplasmic adaptor subunit [Bacteroides sp. 214]|uniref:efflux RND transporter periplasmic adaptor subunit n=1 Tax=Bacteroides sp. 214 TaxID=2302935 RepID=UPI0013D4B621|nr:efflux RND transporter periplasmic adaptor subunit [Bacteroides sp. 214]NDW12902.1 efflux RND transporter periplasmic adaptor subunit [Bacteroides sp. 214]